MTIETAQTNDKKTGVRRRSSLSGVLKDLSGNTIGHIYLYATQAKKEDGTSHEVQE